MSIYLITFCKFEAGQKQPTVTKTLTVSIGYEVVTTILYFLLTVFFSNKYSGCFCVGIPSFYALYIISVIWAAFGTQYYTIYSTNTMFETAFLTLLLAHFFERGCHMNQTSFNLKFVQQ